MIRKAPSPVPFEGGLECRPEDRAAPALVIEPAGRRFAPPCPSPPRVDWCRDARARASGTRRALAGARTLLRRRVRAIQRPCAPITVYFFPTGDFCLGSKASLSPSSGHFRSSPTSGPFQGPSACLIGADIVAKV